MWVFPKIMVPPNHPIQIGFSFINHLFCGTSIFGNIHVGDYTKAILPSYMEMIYKVSTWKWGARLSGKRRWSKLGETHRILRLKSFGVVFLSMDQFSWGYNGWETQTNLPIWVNSSVTLLNTTPRNTRSLGWWQLKYFVFFTPKIGEMIQLDYINMFQMGWFNHQHDRHPRIFVDIHPETCQAKCEASGTEKLLGETNSHFWNTPEIYPGHPCFVNGISFPTLPNLGYLNFGGGGLNLKKSCSFAIQDHPKIIPKVQILFVQCCLRKIRSHNGRVKLVLLPVGFLVMQPP